MNLRAFKTYSSFEHIGYLSIHFLPTISYEGFRNGEHCMFLGWLVWAIQIRW